MVKLKDVLPLVRFAKFPVEIFEQQYEDVEKYQWHGDIETQNELIRIFGESDVILITQGPEGNIEISI